MKLQNSIIVSVLVSFVCAAPFVEGRDNKGGVLSNSEHRDESKSITFENAKFVPSSVLRKREVEADNEAAKAVSDLYGNLQSTYLARLHWKDLESKIVDFAKEFERVQELVKTTRSGAFEKDLGYIAKLIEGFKEVFKMQEAFDGCEYPGSELVIGILELKLYALTGGNTTGKTRADKIAESENHLQDYQDLRAGQQKIVPGLGKVFAAQIEKIREIIEDLKEDKRSENELSSGTDATLDDRKTCPEIV
ncbi:hypothetical protein OXX79_003710 [Metschnikowia pulcherrima]